MVSKKIKIRGYLTRDLKVGIESLPVFHYKKPKLTIDKGMRKLGFKPVDWDSKDINFMLPLLKSHLLLDPGDCLPVEITIKGTKQW